jgi:protocatechuate 3,4-dioxygenase beta subunit
LREKEGYRLVAAYNRSPIMQLNLEPDIVEAVQDMQMQKTLTISGRVIDEQGQPVAAAKVNMIEPGPQMFRSGRQSQSG